MGRHEGISASIIYQIQLKPWNSFIKPVTVAKLRVLDKNVKAPPLSLANICGGSCSPAHPRTALWSHTSRNIAYKILTSHSYYLRQMRRYMRLPAFVCLSVCLLARLLKNVCMDLDEMLRLDKCRDMDELINFWARCGL